MSNGPLRVGIGGPVGAGKTTLTEKLAAALAPRLSMAVVTNDIYTREDAEALMRAQVLPSERCLLYTSPSPRDLSTSRMPSSA